MFNEFPEQLDLILDRNLINSLINDTDTVQKTLINGTNNAYTLDGDYLLKNSVGNEV